MSDMNKVSGGIGAPAHSLKNRHRTSIINVLIYYVIDKTILYAGRKIY